MCESLNIPANLVTSTTPSPMKQPSSQTVGSSANVFESNPAAPQINMDKMLQDSGMDQMSAKAYLQKEIFPGLEVALNNVSRLISLVFFI